jgi:carbamoyltransferase
MQSRLNLQIKKRESFRPFAPIVLEDKVQDWFDWPKGSKSKYMLFTANVRKTQLIPPETNEKYDGGDVDLIEIVNQLRSRIPAVTHVDNSARLQTIGADNPLYQLLIEFNRITSIPVLVNTSFNVRNEPIVESPWDAIRCFLTTDIDVLVLGPYLLEKRNQHPNTLRVWLDNSYAGEMD